MAATTIDTLVIGYYPESTLDILFIPRFGDNWNDSIWSGLLRICSSYQVKHLVCCKELPNDRMLQFLEGWSKDQSFPLLLDLETISVVGSKIDSAVLPMIRKSKAYQLNFRPTTDGLAEYCNDILDVLYKSFSTLGPRWSICQINLVTPTASFPLSTFKPEHVPPHYQGPPWIWTGVAVGSHRNCLSMLERNQKARDHCRRACVALLRLKKWTALISNDISILLAKAVWDSRGTHVWSKSDQPK